MSPFHGDKSGDLYLQADFFVRNHPEELDREKRGGKIPWVIGTGFGIFAAGPGIIRTR